MLQTYIIRVLNREETAGAFYKKELQIKKVFRAQKINKNKGQKLYVKWESYKRL